MSVSILHDFWYIVGMETRFKWIGGATWILQVGDIKIACDPVLCPRDTFQDYKFFKTKRLDDPIYTDEDFKGIDFWFLTHDHQDHIDEEGLKKITPDSTIIGHRRVMHYFKGRGFHHRKTLLWSEKVFYTIKNYRVTVRGIPAIHGWNQFFGGLVGDGNGYYISITRGEYKFSVYITGDGVFNPGITEYLTDPDLDLVITNAGAAHAGKGLLGAIIGRITNNRDDIKRLVTVLKPRHVIPVHWGTFSHYRETIDPGFEDEVKGAVFLNPGDTWQKGDQ